MSTFDAFEETYDFEWDVEGHIPFYVGLARESGGPVAELACGTGRIMLPLAREGVEVWGVQPAGPMALRLGRRLTDEPVAVRQLVHVVEADPAAADLGRDFPLVYLAFGGLQLHVQDDQIASVLANVARHVAPGGRFAFDLVMADDLARRHPGLLRHCWTKERHQFRETVSRLEAVCCGEDGSTLETTVFIDTVGETGTIGRRVVKQALRRIRREDLGALLAPHGFVVESTFGSGARRPVTDDEDVRLFVVAKKGG